jgi:hypothetical protein
VADFQGASFEGEANFGAVHIESQAVFKGAIFKQKASFYDGQLEADAFFDSATSEDEAHGTSFEGEANFMAVHIGGAAEFTGATFKQEASFYGAQIQDSASFDSASFEGEADFAGIRIVTGDLLLRETRFNKRVRLTNASFRTIFVAPAVSESLQTSFGPEAHLDWRGCTYDRIHPVSAWRKLMCLQEPYSREPFTQLEQWLRRAGHEDEAAEVYYACRLRELQQKKKWRPAWITDMLLRYLRYLTGFGVRVSWLLWYIIPILVAGTIIFSLDGTLEPQQPTSPMAVASLISEPKTLQGISPARYINAALMSLGLFLPIADIPTVGEWQVSSGIKWGVPWLTLWATFMIVTGWILVPIGIAGLTGHLKR